MLGWGVVAAHAHHGGTLASRRRAQLHGCVFPSSAGVRALVHATAHVSCRTPLVVNTRHWVLHGYRATAHVPREHVASVLALAAWHCCERSRAPPPKTRG